MPSAINAIWIASVPELTPTQCLAPQNFASVASSSATSGPRMNWQCASTRSSLIRRSAAMRACSAYSGSASRSRTRRATRQGLYCERWMTRATPMRFMRRALSGWSCE